MSGANNRSLISAHFCISAYFLTAETYKRMRLTTRLYGMHEHHASYNVIVKYLSIIQTPFSQPTATAASAGVKRPRVDTEDSQPGIMCRIILHIARSCARFARQSLMLLLFRLGKQSHNNIP